MKVLLVNKFHYKKGGSETYYFTMAEALKKAGHEVIFFAMQSEKNEECKEAEYFVSNASYNGGLKGKIKMATSIAYSKEAYKKLDSLLEKEKPDLAILNLVHRQITLSVIDALKKHNVKIFWTMHDLIAVCPSYTMLDGDSNICEKCLDGNFKHCLETNCIKQSKLMSLLGVYEAMKIRKKDWYNYVDLYICPSEFYKNKLTEGKFTNSKIIHMKNPLPLDTKYEVTSSTNEYILYFGRLSKEKGVKTLIDSMKNIDYKLYVLGTGPLKEELEQYVVNCGLSEKVKMLGFKTGDELTKYISEARCVVLPSEWYENGPYSAMEAMSKGRPLIVSNNGGLPELVEHEVNGYIYEDSARLAEYIQKMISLEDNKYISMEEASLKKAKENFNAEKYVKSIEKWMEEVK